MAMYLNAPPTGATGTSGDDEFIFRSQAVFQLAGAVNGRGGFDRLVFDGNVSLNDLAFGRVFNMESLVLNGTGTQKLTFGHSAGAAFAQGIVDVDASKAGALTLNAGGIGPGARVVVTGSAGDDAITGGAGDDVIDGGAGNDVIKGGLGNDVLRGAAGDDVIHGGAGDDRIEGGDGNDTLRGEAGDDALAGGAGDDALYGGAGDDVLEGGDGNDLLRGDAGDDVLRGGAGDDTLSGMDGEDVLEGGAGNDILMGGAGADRLDGGAGDDRLSGGDGDDSLCGDEGDDVLDGDAGNDLLWGGDGDDRLYGGDGNDMLTGGFGADKLYGEAGNDVLLSRSDAGEPKIMQRTTAKAVHAADALLEADDRLTGGAGADTFRFELLMDAKREVAARHVNADGTIDWAGVARENGSPHDHWVNGIGIDRIMDFNRAEGDRIEIFGHTVKATLRLMDSDGDGVKDYSEILLTSDQGANGGAHHGDKLGTIKVFGDLLTERDVTVNAAVHYGAFATLDDPRDTECCGVMPGGIMGSDHLMG